MRNAGISGSTTSAKPGAHHHLDAGSGIRAEQQLGQLGLDSLGRDAAQLVGHRGHRVGDLGRDLDAQRRDEPSGPQHPQRVVGERLTRRGWRAQLELDQIGQAAERIGEPRLAGHAHRHRIDREVAAAQIGLERVAVDHLGMPAHPVVVIGAVGGDLAHHALYLSADRPELDPRGPTRRRQSVQDGQDLFRTGVGREVQILGAALHQRIAHGAANQVQLMPGRGERGAELARRRGHVDQIGWRSHGVVAYRDRRGSTVTIGPWRTALGQEGRTGRTPLTTTAAPRAARPAGPGPSRSAARQPGGQPGRQQDRQQRRRRPRWLRQVDEFSAGGLVVDLAGDIPRGALIARTDRHGRLLWSLPKGHIEQGETAEQAAVREVEEETGIAGVILAELGTIDFWFVAENRRIHKTVRHYLLRAIGGELSDADIEVAEVAWVPLPEIAAQLAYPDERGLVDTAGRLLAETA